MDRVRNLVFKYLDGLFEQTEIILTQDYDYEEYIKGHIGDDFTLFLYEVKPGRIYFDSVTFWLIRDMFDINADEAGELISHYLSLKLLFDDKEHVRNSPVYMYHN